jgi:hypothetical protein
LCENLRTPTLRNLRSSSKRHHPSFEYRLNADEVTRKGAERTGHRVAYISPMLPVMFIRRTTAILAAVMGGFGVFFAVYSAASPEAAAQAIMLLGCAGALSHFGERP